MLPWFIYLLLQWGYLTKSQQWFDLTPHEQQELEYIIGTETNM